MAGGRKENSALLALALAGLEARIALVDDVNPATAAHDTAVSVAFLDGFERVYDFHAIVLRARAGAAEPDINDAARRCQR